MFRRGFTLIELLVVVAIIAVLVGILLPALSSARNSAKEVGCMSNLRECSKAMLFYTQDTDEFLPGTNGLWAMIAEDYLNLPISGLNNPAEWVNIGKGKTLSVFYCPSDPDPFPRPWCGLEITSYMTNGADYSRIMPPSQHLGIGLFGGRGKITSPAFPSACMMLGENCNYDRVLDCDHPSVNISDKNIRERMHYRYTSGFYHDGRMNILFADGHSAPIAGKHAAPVTPPSILSSAGATFFPNLRLPNATENPMFWGPPYDTYAP